MLCEAAVVDLRRVVVAEPKNNEARRMLSALKGREAPAQAEEAKEASENPFAGMFGDQKASGVGGLFFARVCVCGGARAEVYGILTIVAVHGLRGKLIEPF